MTDNKNIVSFEKPTTAPARREAGPLSVDPEEIHRSFPMRWQAYIRANFQNVGAVERAFGVSERAARKWWNGETGANGGHVAVAVQRDPETAPQMLFAAE